MLQNQISVEAKVHAAAPISAVHFLMHLLLGVAVKFDLVLWCVPSTMAPRRCGPRSARSDVWKHFVKSEEPGRVVCTLLRFFMSGEAGYTW